MFSLFWGSVPRRVARGVKLLDTYNPEWFNRVDLDTLHMGSATHCVLAQVTGADYHSVLKALGLSNRQGMAHGFDGWRRDDFYGPWNELRQEWVRVIRERQTAQLENMVQPVDVTHG